MAVRQKLGELVVPAIVLVGCLLYWLHVQDARAVARRVPNGVILFTVAMTMLALMREFIWPPAGEQDAESSPPVERDVLIKRLLFVMLCFGYFLAFSWLGFNLANLTFLVFAYILAGMKFLGAVPAAICSSVVFHFLARVMDFNVPTGPLGF
ncbi:tripartite tricarboxylate transporter TctB family protein [Alkalilacustris brevis]|uniref:tripartite tricarboxylate transporter TctB family protein n=1 Tax=Alkalilacustris brevis TaxID=2026338 RepID=UPI0012D31B6E|nr:hypothetical protein [Alkalilacustris brevis]